MKKIVAVLLAVIMVFAVSAVAYADLSPASDTYFKIAAGVEGDGTVSASTNKVLKGSGETVTLTATPKDGTFKEWIIKGVYDIVEGSLNTQVITIRPDSDITAVANFTGSTKPGDKDDDKTSPKTGDPLYAVIPFMMLALAAAFIASKKLRTEK